VFPSMAMGVCGTFGLASSGVCLSSPRELWSAICCTAVPYVECFFVSFVRVRRIRMSFALWTIAQC
jgi:hypothetical protein